ncbi:MAG TPA: hypothetical protein VFH73_22195 [Polyangia bacterium]|nr:hypothetical protein [Polyangia bacterium]
MTALLACFIVLAASLVSGCADSTSSSPPKAGGTGGVAGQTASGGGGASGSGAAGGGMAMGAGGAGGAQRGSGGAAGAAGAGGTIAPDSGANGGETGASPDADGNGKPSGKPFAGPFMCTEVIGLLTTGEWYNAGFEDGLGAELGARWQGRFAHYGYVMEYAKPDSYAWSPTPVGGTNNVSMTAPCTQGGATPDRIVYQAWSWELTTEEAWVTNLEAALATIRSKRPSVRRVDLMTIVRCPMNGWCHPDKPPLGPDTDHNAGKQDCHVPEFVDSAFARVASNHPDLVTVAPKFEAHACAANIDGIHLGGANRPVAADIATYYKTMP